jgi:hypothetical protein
VPGSLAKVDSDSDDSELLGGVSDAAPARDESALDVIMSEDDGEQCDALAQTSIVDLPRSCRLEPDAGKWKRLDGVAMRDGRRVVRRIMKRANLATKHFCTRYTAVARHWNSRRLKTGEHLGGLGKGGKTNVWSAAGIVKEALTRLAQSNSDLIRIDE